MSPEWYRGESGPSESQVLKIFFLLSAAAHAGLAILNPSDRSTPPDPGEMIIEAELAIGDPQPWPGDRRQSETMDGQKAKKMLPQLPKRLQLNASKDQGGAVGAEGQVISGGEKKQESGLEPALQAIGGDSEATEQYRSEIFRRLKRELKRQKSREKKQRLEEQKDARIAGELLGRRKKNLSSIAGVRTEHPYIRQLQRRINSNYAPPAVYSGTGVRSPVLLLTIGRGGELESVRMIQSSDNPALDRYAEKSITEMSPFPRPPRELWGLEFQVHLGSGRRS